MIVLFTDFGLSGPYVGQVKAVLAVSAPGTPVIDLFADAPTSDPRAAAYLLATYDDVFAPETVFLCVVDPGVGSDRPAVVLRADDRWYVGPGNGLFELVRRRARAAELFEICWRPSVLSASFHGRDLFAPVAARLARGDGLADILPSPDLAMPGQSWPDDLAEIVYIDHYGNCLTGLRGQSMDLAARLKAGGHFISHARIYTAVAVGEAFWYVNSNGLVEIAVAQGRADVMLGLRIGAPISILV